jgi:hypothetical protein
MATNLNRLTFGLVNLFIFNHNNLKDKAVQKEVNRRSQKEREDENVPQRDNMLSDRVI